MQSRLKAVLDANVLFSNQQRNLLLQLAEQEVIRVAWTKKIELEWLTNLKSPTRQRIESRTLPLIRKFFPDAFLMVRGAPKPIGQTDAKDIHVAAAAVFFAPCRLITWNVRHFDAAALSAAGVAVQTPDSFLCELFDGNPELIIDITRQAQKNMTKSAPTWDSYLDVLGGKGKLKQFVARLRDFERAKEATSLRS
jgi:hypothetical protein